MPGTLLVCRGTQLEHAGKPTRFGLWDFPIGDPFRITIFLRAIPLVWALLLTYTRCPDLKLKTVDKQPFFAEPFTSLSVITPS